MKTLNIKQNTPEWDEFRANHFNASEVAAMLGISPYMKRDELLKEKAFGISKEYDNYTQKLFAYGHKVENLYRNNIAENLVGDELFPAVGVSEIHTKLAASFDGITLLNDVIFEHKTLNNKLEQITNINDLPEHYKVQMEQQLLVSGATKCLFAASRYDENDNLIKEIHFWYESDNNLRERIIAGWEQFQKDLDNFKQKPIITPPKEIIVSKELDLPILNIEVIGKVNSSNLTEYKQVAVDIFNNIKTDLQTDEDFAVAENDLKFCKKIETQIKQAKDKAIQQQSSVAELFAMLDEIANTARDKRLKLEKLTKNRKDEIKAEIISYANKELNEFIYELNKQSYPFILTFDNINLSLVKGIKTLAGLKDKVATEVANLKIDFQLKHNDLIQKQTYFKQVADNFVDEFSNEFTQLSLMPFDSFKRYVNERVENIKFKQTQQSKVLTPPEQANNNNNISVGNVSNNTNNLENLIDDFMQNHLSKKPTPLKEVLIQFYHYLHK